jgi:hypothetical protein
MIIGHLTFIAFLIMWNPSEDRRWSHNLRFFLGGLAGGMSVLLDYSGLVLLGGLFCYAVAKALDYAPARKVLLPTSISYALGALGPILLLWFYQWASFGDPFKPGQHWMPPVEWIEIGYQGFTSPQADLLSLLLFDYRYGLFVTCPLMLLALLAPWLNRGARRVLSTRELALILYVPIALWLFCGCISYVRLQYNNGLRYLAPLLPYMFVLTAIALMRLPRRFAYLLATVAVAQAWSMAMYRDVERGFGVLDPVLHVFIGGLQLPVLTVLSRMNAYGDYAASGVSPLPILAVVAAVVFVIWSGRDSADTRIAIPESETAVPLHR